MSTTKTSNKDQIELDEILAHDVTTDLTEWYIHHLIRQRSSESFALLDNVLPHLSPLDKRSIIAAKLRVIALWKEVLEHTHLDGDFSMLQDRLLLLSTHFGKSESYQYCVDLVSVHEEFCKLYKKCNQNEKGRLDKAVMTFRGNMEAIFVSRGGVPSSLLNVAEDPQHIEVLVQDSEHVYGYSHLLDQIQNLLVQWIDSRGTPLLIQLGYRLTGVVASASRATTNSATSSRETTVAAAPVPRVATPQVRMRTPRSRRTPSRKIVTRGQSDSTTQTSNLTDHATDATPQISRDKDTINFRTPISTIPEEDEVSVPHDSSDNESQNLLQDFSGYSDESDDEEYERLVSPRRRRRLNKDPPSTGPVDAQRQRMLLEVKRLGDLAEDHLALAKLYRGHLSSPRWRRHRRKRRRYHSSARKPSRRRSPRREHSKSSQRSVTFDDSSDEFEV